MDRFEKLPDIRRRATALDVAQAAGVSKWTVTRAFKPGASIAPDSRARVMAAAAALGYSPNLLARSLATRTTQQIAVLVDDFANPMKLPVLELLSAALQAEGLVMLLLNIHQQFGHVNAFLDADQRQVDAIVLLGTAFRDDMLQQHALNVAAPPLYVLARESRIPTIPWISCDAARSMQEICEHLWQRGYRRPAFMSGPRTMSAGLGRKSCFEAFWHEHGAPVVPEIAAGDYDRSAGYRACARYLADTPPAHRADVLMCENDTIAIGAIDAARSGCGLRVPEQLAIVGYDDNDMASAPAFALTTYRQPFADMVRILVDMLCGRREPGAVELRGQLVIRSST